MIHRSLAARLCLGGMLLTLCGCGVQNAINIHTNGSYSHTHNVNGEPAIEGSGNPADESRDVSPFDGIRLEVASAITITKNDEPSLSIRADDNILPIITSTVEEDGTLVVAASTSFSTNTKITITTSLPVLRRLTINGSADAQLDSVTDDSLQIHLAGAGQLTGTGTVETLTATIDGAGDLQVAELQSVDCEVTINGAGSARVHASSNLKATINGAGSILYAGSPGHVAKQVNGVGTVQPE